MATPQLEDGYTRIANDLFEAVIAFDFSKRQSKIVFAIIRKTYGFQKKTDVISLSQFTAMTGLGKAGVSKALAELFDLGVVVYGISGKQRTVGLNKNYSKWGLLPKQSEVAKTATHPKVTKTTTDGCQNDNKKVAKTTTTKEKKEITKEKGQGELLRHQPKKLPKRKAALKELDPSEYPDWLDVDAWNDFKAHRIAIKKPMTALAEKIGLKKLGQYRLDESQRDIIERSIFGGWQDLYPKKDLNSNQGQSDKQPQSTVFVSPRNQTGDGSE